MDQGAKSSFGSLPAPTLARSCDLARGAGFDVLLGAEMQRITDLVNLASTLLGTTPTTSSTKSNLSSLLLQRLVAYRALAGLEDGLDDNLTIAKLKQQTAEEARSLLNQIHLLISTPTASTSTATDATPIFSPKHIKMISMLAGVVGRWLVVPNLTEGIIPTSSAEITRAASLPGTAKITEISDVMGQESMEEDQKRRILEETVMFLLQIINPSPEHSHYNSPQHQLAAIVSPQIIVPVLAALVDIVYNVHNEAAWASNALQDLVSKTSPVIIISHLLKLMSTASKKNEWLRPALSNLLSERLAADGGVRSLLIIVIGDDENTSTSKLSTLSQLLRAGVTGSNKLTYLSNITTQLLAILQRASDSTLPISSSPNKGRPSPPPPTSITQAAAFMISDLIDRYPISIGPILLPYLHSAFLPAIYPASSLLPHDPSDTEALDPLIISTHELRRAVALISTIILHAPPSPHLFPVLLNSILPTLFALNSYLTKTKADESMRDEVGALLEIWGKSRGVDEVVKSVVRAVEKIEKGDEFGRGVNDAATGFYWARSDEGSVCVRMKHELIGGRQNDDEVNELKLDPEGMIHWFKSVEKREMTAAVFLRWLDEVQVLRNEEGFAAAKRSVLRLQLVLKMVDEFGSELLHQPTQIIAFIAHALSSDAMKVQKHPVDRDHSKVGLNLDDLRLVAEDEMAQEGEDEEALLPGSGVDEITMTAITLLLAVLETNESLSPSTTPLLVLIFDKLEALAESSSEIISPLAREARMILSLRRAANLSSPASTSTTSSTTQAFDPLAASRERYQEALRLLQDQILPVRAQGLSILRSLVATRSALLLTDPALLPAILDIFILAIEDEDSFLYLNAVEGLSCMVDVCGKQIVVRLVMVYSGGRKKGDGVGEGEKGRRELDKRLRIGESLVRVVQRAGEALSLFVDDLLPSLLLILRTSTLPTPLRSSALTILATAIESAPIALLNYADTLTEACLTLLSVESRPLQPRRPPPPSDGNDDDDDNLAPALDRHGKLKRPEETPDPVAADSKHPVLRRSAVLFLGMIFRAARVLSEDASERGSRGMNVHLTSLGSFSLGMRQESSTTRGLVSFEERKRARIVLTYVADTDEDSLVRFQCREVLEEL